MMAPQQPAQLLPLPELSAPREHIGCVSRSEEENFLLPGRRGDAGGSRAPTGEAGSCSPPLVLSFQVLCCPRKTSCDDAFLRSCYCRSSWLPLKQESFFMLLATVTVWCDIFPFGQKLGNKYNKEEKKKVNRKKKMRSNCSVTLLQTVGFDVLFFSQRLSGGGGRRVHWWWWCVCAYRGSLVHKQLRWARCAAGGEHWRRQGWRWRGRRGVGAGAQLCALFRARSPSLTCPLPPSFSLPLSLARALSPI